MAARYQFGWMDDVTQLFEGYPIDIISKYVNPDNIEQIDISKFTSDIDYILLNPWEISKDGFVLMAAVTNYSENSATMTLRAGVSHSSNNDRVFVNINDGDNYSIKLSNLTGQLSQDVLVAIYAKYGEESQSVVVWSGTMTLNQNVNLVAHGNITSIGIYFNGQYVESSGTAQFSVYFKDGVRLPYINFSIDASDHILQNAYVAFMFLQRYYAFDMPAYQYEINGEQMYAYGIKKLKNQTLRFPVLNDPDLVQLVKTNMGNGTIEKLSVNLSSRNANATLKYDTE
jgi:hypothetical protein